MTIESATDGVVYPRYRQKPGEPNVVQAQIRFRGAWIFEAHCATAALAREWIWQRTRTDGGAWVVVNAEIAT